MGDKKAETTDKAFSVITPLLGLGTQLATSIPGMRKAPKSNARVSGLPIAQAAMGVAGQGYASDRGGNALAGLRAAGQAGQMVASQQYQASAFNQQQDFRNRDIRNLNLQTFGKDTADFTANLATGLVNNANARAAERQAQSGVGPAAGGEIGNVFPSDIQNQQTGLMQQQPMREVDKTIQQGQQGLDQLTKARQKYLPQGPPTLEQMQQNPAATQTSQLQSLQMELDALGQQAIASKTEALDQANAALGMMGPSWLKPVAPWIEEQTRRSQIAVEEINKAGLSMQVMLPRVMRSFGSDLIDHFNPPVNPGFDEGDNIG